MWAVSKKQHRLIWRIVLTGIDKMNTHMRFNIIILLSLMHNTALADGWQLYKADDSTKVEYRYSETNLLQISVATEVDSRLGAFLHLLEDTANIRAWAANTEKAELLGQPDANTHIVHTYFTAIWPVSKRDMVT